MARIRSVHPGLWTDEAFVSVADAAKLLYLGLWGEADDNGFFEWKPLTIKMRLRAGSAETVGDIGDLLAALVVANMIGRFTIDGKDYGAIRNFAKYQRPKVPKGIDPMDPKVRNFVGLMMDGRRPNAGTGRPSTQTTSELLPNSPPLMEELGPLMEEEGGEKEEGKEAAQQTSKAHAKEKDPPDLEAMERSLREAAGLLASEAAGLADLTPIIALIEKGYDFAGDILPVIRARAAKASGVRSWRYFVAAIEESKALNGAIRPNEKDKIVAAVTWVLRDDPRWLALAEKYTADKGKAPPAIAGMGGLGWHFPAEMVAGVPLIRRLTAAELEARRAVPVENSPELPEFLRRQA